MPVSRRALRAVLVAVALTATGSTAHATPPEGCVGFPDIPEAWVCVTTFDPQALVPTVTPGGTPVATVPTFCAFGTCLGPTPVSAPSVTFGGGSAVVIEYDGQTYAVPEPATGPARPLAGVGCRVAASNDPTGQVNQNAKHFYGDIAAGPLFVGSSLLPPSMASGTLACWVQIDDGLYDFGASDQQYGYPGYAGARTSGAGVLAAADTVVEYDVDTTVDQYLCGAVLDVGGDPSNDWLWDNLAVDPDTGEQTGQWVPASSAQTPTCRLTISAG